MRKLAAIVSLLGVFLHSLIFFAGENAPDYRIRSIIATFVRNSYRIANNLRRFWSLDMGLWWMREMTPPHKSAHYDSVEETIQLENFEIFVWKHKELVEAPDQPVVFFFHGGGFMIGDIPLHRRFYSSIAVDRKVTVVTVEYRRTPEVEYPTPFDDCYEAVEYTIENAKRLKIDPSRIVLTGDSAGGHLTLTVGMHLAASGRKIAGLVPMYPMTQIVTGNLPSYTTGEEGGLITAQGWAWAAALALCGRDYETMMNKLRTGETYHAVKQAHPKLIAERFGEFDKTIPAFDNPQVDKAIIAKMIDAKGSPLLAPESFFKTMPRTHIFAAEHDVLYDDQVAFTKVAEMFGSDIQMTTWKGAFHIEQSFSKLWSGKSIMKSCDENIRLYVDAITAFHK